MANPYFFVEKDALPIILEEIETDKTIFLTDDVGKAVEMTTLKSIDGKEVIKVNCKAPRDVAILRDKLESLGFKTYEADIPYERVLYKDYKKKCAYEMDDVTFLDIECDDSQGYRGYGQSKIVAVTVGRLIKDKPIIKTFLLTNYGNEKQMLHSVLQILTPVVAGWNVEYDVKNLLRRAGRLGVPDLLAESLLELIDLRDEYKSAVKGLTRYTLEEVADYEKIGQKKHVGKKICQMTAQELYERNRGDVELLLKLEQKYGFVEKKLRLANEVNLPLHMLTPYQIWDTLVLRRLRDLGYVAPNAKKVDKPERYEGAFVKEPVAGLHDDVLVLDVRSLYPNIVVHENIDIDGFKGEVMPLLMRLWMTRKDAYEKAGDKIGREVAKLIANSGYGQFGYTAFRFYDKKKAEAITKKGREILKKAMKIVERCGWQVIYGDTDSLFVKKVKNSVSEDDLIKTLNTELAPYEFKKEHVFKKLLLFKKGEEQGAKKRYVGVEESGQLFARGIELRRGDWCMLTKRVLEEFVRKIFDGVSKDEIDKFLRDVKQQLYAGKYDDELVIRKGVRKEYKVKTPQGEAFKKAVEKGLLPEDATEVEYVKTVDGIEPYEVGKKYSYDYEYYWKKQIEPVVKRVLEAAGLGEKKMIQVKLEEVM